MLQLILQKTTRNKNPGTQKKRQQATTPMRTHMRREKEEPIASHDTKKLDSAAARKAKLKQLRRQTTPTPGTNSRRHVKPQRKREPDVQQVHELKKPAALKGCSRRTKIIVRVKKPIFSKHRTHPFSMKPTDNTALKNRLRTARVAKLRTRQNDDGGLPD